MIETKVLAYRNATRLKELVHRMFQNYTEVCFILMQSDFNKDDNIQKEVLISEMNINEDGIINL